MSSIELNGGYLHTTYGYPVWTPTSNQIELNGGYLHTTYGYPVWTPTTSGNIQYNLKIYKNDNWITTNDKTNIYTDTWHGVVPALYSLINNQWNDIGVQNQWVSGYQIELNSGYLHTTYGYPVWTPTSNQIELNGGYLHTTYGYPVWTPTSNQIELNGGRINTSAP